MQSRNLIVFIVLTAVVLIGWAFLQRRLWPPPAPKPAAQEEQAARLTPAQQRGGIVAALVTAPPAGLPGLATAYLAGELVGARKSLFPEIAKATEKKLSPVARAAMGGVSTATLTAAFPPVLGGWVVAAARLSPQAPAPAAGRLESVTLGGAGYDLTVVLTTRGAGVQSLTLNRFQAANREGRPVYAKVNGEREKVPLELIREDSVNPSFTLYHFPDPGKAGEEPSGSPTTTLGEVLWKLEKKTDDEATFSTSVPGYDHLRIVKTYSLRPHEYHVGLTIEIRDERPDKAGPARAFRYQQAGPHGLPIEGVWYTYTYRNAVIGLLEGGNNLYRTLEDSRRISHLEGGPRVPEGPRAGDALVQYAVVATQFFASGIVVDDRQPPAEEGGVPPRDILAWARPTLETREVRGKLATVDLKAGEVGVADTAGMLEVCRLLPRARRQLLDLGLKPGDEILLIAYDVNGQPYAGDVYPGSGSRPFLNDVTVRVNSELVELRPGEKRVHRFLLYNGPVKVTQLDQFSGDEEVDPDLVNRYAGTLHLNTLTDYQSAGPFGWFASRTGLTTLFIFCTKVMHWVLGKLLWLVPVKGLSIILLTVLVRGALFPISRKQALMSQKMQALAPELKKVQEKYKNDPQARTAAMMELYRKHGVNPLGGCLPLFLQMPIFLGLYWALQESIRFRLAPFLWIDNLAAPDMLFRWGEWIPWISDPNNMGGALGFPASLFYLGPYFSLLPCVAVAFMLVQQKMMLPPPTDDQQAMQQKMMKWMMVVFGIFFYKVAAGLCLYFIASSLWGLAERKLLPRRQGVPAVPPADRPAAPGGRGGPGGKSGPAPSRGPTGRGKPRGKKADEDTRFQKVRDWWQEILKQAKKK
jgi:YidC/Oxa1 family membrane protein insertase